MTPKRSFTWRVKQQALPQNLLRLFAVLAPLNHVTRAALFWVQDGMRVFQSIVLVFHPSSRGLKTWMEKNPNIGHGVEGLGMKTPQSLTRYCAVIFKHTQSLTRNSHACQWLTQTPWRKVAQRFLIPC